MISKLFCLSACLVLMACPSGPSSSAPDRVQGQEEATAVESKADFIGGLLGRRHEVARLMDSLTAALPDRVRLTEVVFDSDGVRLKGIAPSNNLLADYIGRLEGSPCLTGVALQSSVQKSGRTGDYQEFALQAIVEDPCGDGASAPGSAAALQEEFEKLLPAGQETADILRQIQMLASDAGLQMTGFAPGNRMSGEFYDEWPVSIEVTGSQKNLRRYFSGMIDLPRLWLVKRFSFKAISNQDAGSPVRASITAQTYFWRESSVARPRR